jgi:MFS family permease
MSAAAEAALDPERERRPGLFRNWRFIALFVAQGASQVAQSAILFTLLILVLRETDSTFNTSILVFAFITPSLVFGVAAGVLVDRWNKRSVLIYISLLRMASCLVYLLVSDDLVPLLVNTVAFSTFSQFFTPAQVALIPSMVRREQLVSANGVFNFTLMVSQFAGLVFVAPTLLISLGAESVFVVCSLLYTLSALAAASLPDIEQGRHFSVPIAELNLYGSIREEILRGWGLLRSDPVIGLATAQLTLSATLVLLFSILVPRFLRDVLELDPDKAVIVFAPTGIGAIIALRTLPWFTARLPLLRVTLIGLIGIAVSVFLMSLVEPFGSLLAQWQDIDPFKEDPERLAGLSILAAISMAIAAPIGLSYALVNSPAQTILQERTPPELRAQVFATQLAFANVVSILPLLVVGAMTDLIGVSMMLLGVSILVAISAAASVWVERRYIPKGVPEEAAVAEARAV